MPKATEGAEGFDYEMVEMAAFAQASSWTETVKEVFFIRVDFSDNTGESVSQALLEQLLDQDVATVIEAMSLGKTSIDADVSSQVVRLPSPTSTYLPNNNNLLYEDALDAFNALSTGINLGDYDIVGVHFTSLGMQSSGGITYAGLAGGSRQWLQGTTNAGVIIHEFGHNYGLAHARQWDTSDGTVLGAGSSVEYGDISDIMGDGPEPEAFFHAQARDRLNWYEDEVHWTDASTAGTGTYRIYQLDDADTTQNLRGARITRAADEYIWIGYRGNLGNAWFENGAYLVWQQPETTSGWLMDTTPDSEATTSTDAEDAPLLLGRTFSDSDIHITPIAKGGSSPDAWLDVHVEFGPFPANNAPTGTISGNTTVTARSPQLYSTTAADIDGDTLAYFWDTQDSTIHENLSSIEQTFNVGGTYSIDVTISDMKGGIITASETVTVSDPLDSWSTGTTIAGRSFTSINYLNGRLIATGDDYIATSLDGVTWSEYYENNLRAGGVAYGNGVYVIAALDYDFDLSDWVGVLYSSEDGFTWVDRTSSTTEQFRDVTFGNGRFVAVGDAGLIQTSSDGISWQAVAAPTTEDIEQIAFGGGVFVAVSDNGVWRSTDGTNWTNHWASLGLDSWRSLRDVFYHQGRFYVGGFYAGIQYSTDGGLTWTSAVLPAGNYSSYDFAAEANTIVLLADAEDEDALVVLVSADGTTWSESSAAPAGGTRIDYGNGSFQTVYNTNGALDQTDSLYPSNSSPSVTILGPTAGDARTYLTFTATVNDSDGDDLVYSWQLGDGTRVEGTSVTHRFSSGGVFDISLTVTDQKGGVTTDTHQVNISDSLNTWNTVTSGTTANLYDICDGNGRLLAVGDSSGTYRYSDDASSWNGGSLGLNHSLYGVIWDGAQFIAVGRDYDFDLGAWVGVIYSSTDATSWTLRYRGNQQFNDIAFNGSTYVAVGQNGTYATSSDGLSWSTASFGIGANVNNISFGNGTFVAVGGSGGLNPFVLTSTDGLSWVDQSAGVGTPQELYKLHYCDDLFLTSGFYARLRTSTDNGQSFVSNRSNREQIEAFAYGNELFFAAGIDKDNSDAPVTLTSENGVNWLSITTPAVNYIRAAVFYQNTFIMVGNGGEIWQTDPFTGFEFNPFVDWQLTYFTSVVEDGLPGNDFEGDGLSNLYEYFVGGDPTVNDPTLGITAEWNGNPLIRFPKDPSVSGMQVDLLKSVDLSNWIPASYTDVSVSPDEVVLDISDMPSSGTPLFLRVVISED